VFPQERHQRVAPPALQYACGLRSVPFPALEILQRIVHLAPGPKHEAAHFVRIADRVIGRDRGAEGDRDDDRTLDAETFDQLLEVAGLIYQ